MYLRLPFSLILSTTFGVFLKPLSKIGKKRLTNKVKSPYGLLGCFEETVVGRLAHNTRAYSTRKIPVSTPAATDCHRVDGFIFEWSYNYTAPEDVSNCNSFEVASAFNEGFPRPRYENFVQ